MPPPASLSALWILPNTVAAATLTLGLRSSLSISRATASNGVKTLFLHFRCEPYISKME